MPSLDNVNKARLQNGAPALTEAEFAAHMDRLRVPPEVPPEPSQRTLDIRAGLIDPNEGDADESQ